MSNVDDLKYYLANPRALDVKHTKPIPQVRSKIMVVKDDLMSNQSIRILVKNNDIVTVNDVYPIISGTNGDYHWEYEVYTEELGDSQPIIYGHYKIVE